MTLPRSPYAILGALVGVEPGDTAKVCIGTFGMAPGQRSTRGANRYVELRRGPFGLIEVWLFGSRIAELSQDGRVALYACGYGDRATTRAALSFALTGQYGNLAVYSHRRKLYALGEPFREGITFQYRSNPRTLTVADPGHGDHLDGAPARQRRAS